MAFEMRDDCALRKEAGLFAGYILGRPPEERICALYMAAMARLVIVPRGKDERLLRFVLRNPSCVGLVDAGTALLMRDSAFRKKLLVMFAIVECSPGHSDLFLPRARPPLYPLWILWSGCRAALKALLGALIIRLI